MWNALQNLCNVEVLDFCSLARGREDDAPPPLFPSSTSICLTGPMSFTMMKSILHSVDPSKITRLELDNLQDFGQRSRGKDLHPLDDLSKLRESQYPDGSPKLRHPGPMRGHLQPLVGSCKVLKHLSLRSAGQDIANDSVWSVHHDRQRYEEWAMFIESVKDTLESLEIEQGIPAEDPHQNGSCRQWDGPMQTLGRPMDLRFVELVLPVISSGPWAHLKTMTIRGVGGSVLRSHRRGCRGGRWQSGSLIAAPMRLRTCLPPDVVLTFEKEASKTFWHRLRSPSYRT